jgi:protein-tyrosine phosphatase
MNVLLLCTGNLCRSPMAEQLLARHLRTRGVEAIVSSAGRSYDGQASPAPVLDVVNGLGLDLSRHRSRLLTPEMLQQADLVVGMAREHVRDALALDAEVFPKAFTLKELVRRGEAAGARRPDEDVASWVSRVGSGRSATALLGSARADDVADPIGGPVRGYRRTFRELDGLTGRLAALLA